MTLSLFEFGSCFHSDHRIFKHFANEKKTGYLINGRVRQCFTRFLHQCFDFQMLLVHNSLSCSFQVTWFRLTKACCWMVTITRPILIKFVILVFLLHCIKTSPFMHEQRKRVKCLYHNNDSSHCVHWDYHVSLIFISHLLYNLVLFVFRRCDASHEEFHTFIDNYWVGLSQNRETPYILDAGHHISIQRMNDVTRPPTDQ